MLVNTYKCNFCTIQSNNRTFFIGFNKSMKPEHIKLWTAKKFARVYYLESTDINTDMYMCENCGETKKEDYIKWTTDNKELMPCL